MVDFRYHDGSRLIRLNVGTAAIALVRTFNSKIVRRLGELYPEGLMRARSGRSPLELRVARAVHWYSQGEGQSDETLAFVCYWIGLEALVLKSSSSSQKKRTIARRLASLVGRHDSTIDGAAVIEELWGKRADVLHEGFGAIPSGVLPAIAAAEINCVRYLFVLTLLYVLESRSKGVTLDNLWDTENHDPYSPGVVIRIDEMPSTHQLLSWERERRAAD